MPTVTIDGRACQAQDGETILEVARRHGIWIPTLCYHAALEPYASCRICVVEIDRGGWWQVVTACNYPIRRDLTVRVNSERVIRDREGVMQLLLARSPDSPELRALAARMGVAETPYPKVTEAQRNCILCGLCVRVCEERIGASAISLVGRGVDRAVAAPFRIASDDCIGCGACAAVCPVGTIEVRVHAAEVEIERMGDAYLVTYKRGVGIAYIGIGLRKGNVFCLSWISQGQAGITLYTIESGHRLVGNYSQLGGPGILSEETLTRTDYK